MSEIREPMHQPPNPDDLRRAPPASPECARVRGWLRDFVDRDLDAPRAAELEEHVHRCRTCAVELARTEHETMRLRSALAEMRGARATLPRDFAARVVERLVVDETSMVPKDTIARAAALASAQAEAGVPGPVAADASARSREAGPRVQPAVLLIASLLLLWGLTFGVEVFGDLFASPRHESRLIVVAAVDTFSGYQRLGVGDGLGNNQALRAGARGSAQLDLLDSTAKSQPAARLQVHPGGEVGLDGGSLRMHGMVDLETYREVSLTLSDGSHVDLGVGTYRISSLERRSDDPSLPSGELKVEVEVRTGQPASIVRSGFDPTLVAAGEVGTFQGNDGTMVTTGGGGGLASAPVAPRQPNENPPSASALLFARALDPTGSPVPASVRLKGGRSHSLDLSVNLGFDGTMQLQMNGRLDTDFLTAFAVAPESRDDLGVLARDAYRVIAQGANQALAEPLQFRTSHPFHGQIVDENVLACENVQVVPCIVDDLFGAVWPMPELRGTTDAFGLFRCVKLPARLLPHQSLRLLLLGDEGLAPTVYTIPERSGALSTVPFPLIVMNHTRTAGIQALPADTEVEILEEIPSLPGGTGFVRRTASTDSSGSIASIQLGGASPRLWLRDGQNMLRQLGAASYGTITIYRPVQGQDSVPFASKFGATTPIAESTAELVASSRHESLADVGEPVVLQFADSYGYPVVAQVFVVDGAASRGRVNAHFAGFTAADGVVTVRRNNQSILAITPDGSCRVVGALEAPASPLSMPLNGTVQVGASLRPGPGESPMMWLHLKRTSAALVSGQEQSTTRIAAAVTGWEVRDVLPGEYQVTVGSNQYSVTVPSGGTVMVP